MKPSVQNSTEETPVVNEVVRKKQEVTAEMSDKDRQERTIKTGEEIYVCNRGKKCSAIVQATSKSKVKIELAELCEPGGFFSSTMDIKLAGTNIWLDKKHIYKSNEGCVGEYSAW